MTAGATTVDSLKVTNNADLDGNLTVKGELSAANNKFGVDVDGNIRTTGGANIGGDTTIGGALTVTNNANITGNATVGGGLGVTGNATVGGTLNVTDLTTLGGGLTVSGQTKLNDDLAVNGNAEIDGNLKIGTVANVEKSILDLEKYADELQKADLPEKVGGIERDPLDPSVPAGEGVTTIEGMAKFDKFGMTIGDTVVNDGKITVGAADDKTIIDGGAIKAKSLLLGTKDVGETIFGIVRDPENKVTTIEGVTSFTKDGMTTTTVTTSEIGVGGSGFYANSTGITVGNGRFSVDSGTGNLAISNGTVPVFQVNGETGQVNIGANGGSQTVITGNSITTETLNVEKIVLGDKIVDKETGDVIGGELEIGADGSIKIADKFEVDTDNLAAHYGEYELTLDGSGFALGNSKASLTLNGDGYAFDGPVNLGAGSDVKYTGGNYDTLAELDATVKDIYDRTEHISVDESGNTTISSKNGDTTLTVSDDGITMNGNTVMNGDSTTGGEGGSGDGSVTNPNSDHIVNGGQTVNNGQTVNGDAQFNDKVTVGKQGGENGQTVIDGGTITTGDTTIDGSGMTVGTGENATSITNQTVKAQNGVFDNLTAGSGTFGTGNNKTVINNDGVTVGGSDGVSINADGMTVGAGTDIKDGNITVEGDGGKVEIGKGDVAIFDETGEKVTSIQHNYDEINRVEEKFDGEVNRLDNRITKVEDRIDKVGAMSAAIANLRTMGYDPAAPTEIAVGVGQYRSETGVALGMFHYPNKDFMLSLSVSTSGDEVMGGIGATWKFGRKSPEKVLAAEKEKAAKAKLAKAEAMKKAAKEAKIKAQQERHAKLAAERAAQAEAAK